MSNLNSITDSSASTNQVHNWESNNPNFSQNDYENSENNNEDIYNSTSLNAIDNIRKARTLKKHSSKSGTKIDSSTSTHLIKDILRTLYIIIDLSSSMLPPTTSTLSTSPATSSHLPPNKAFCTLAAMKVFIPHFFTTNPLATVGLIILRNSTAEIILPLRGPGNSSNVPGYDHINVLESYMSSTSLINEAKGLASIEKGLNCAMQSLNLIPLHTSREVLMVYASLSTSDLTPQSLLKTTLSNLVEDGIRVSCICLTAELYCAKRITEECDGHFGVPINKNHLKLLLKKIVEPPTRRKRKLTSEQEKYIRNLNEHDREVYLNKRVCKYVEMGYPQKIFSDVPVLVHCQLTSNPSSSSSSSSKATSTTTKFESTYYICPRCQSPNLTVPSNCLVCNLKLISGPDLARSYHCLFYVALFKEVKPIYFEQEKDDEDGEEEYRQDKKNCDGCFCEFLPVNKAPVGLVGSNGSDMAKMNDKGYNISTNPHLKQVKVTSSQLLAKQKPPADVDKTFNISNPASMRLECPKCKNMYCVDCDTYLHEGVYNCVGCLGVT